MMRVHLLALGLLCACGSVPAAPDANSELCFDGLDNDGDTQIDCADADCNPTAVCVPSSTDQPAGVVVAATDACPTGFTGGETIIHRGLQPGGCTGCGCTPGDTTCTATAWTYASANECGSDFSLSGGAQVGFPIGFTCTPNNLAELFLYGVRTIIEAEATCTASGSGTPESSTWTESVKFCRTSNTAAGCATGSACVARAAAPDDQCAIADGAAACAAEYTDTQSDWYTDYDDQRTCGACFCTAVGGDCDNVLLEVGSDYTCGNFNPLVGSGMKECFQSYSPPARLVGIPTPPAGCDADAPISGQITPSGQTTLCCMQ